MNWITLFISVCVYIYCLLGESTSLEYLQLRFTTCNGDEKYKVPSPFNNSLSYDKVLIIKNCSRIKLDTIADINTLDKFIGEDINELIITKNVSSNLKYLELNNIENLIVEPNAFQNMKNMSTILISSSNLNLTTDSINGLKELNYLDIIDSNIADVPEKGLHLENSFNCDIYMENCKISNVDANGIHIHARNINIVSSVVEKVSDSGIIIETQDTTLIQETVIMSHIGIIIKSPKINITSNLFSQVSGQTLNNFITTVNELIEPSFIFNNNRIKEIYLMGSLLEKINNKDISVMFEGNQVKCTCSREQNTLLYIQHHLKKYYLNDNFQNLMRNNFCKSPCNLNLHEFGNYLFQNKTCKNMNEVPNLEYLCSIHNSNSNTANTNSITLILMYIIFCIIQLLYWRHF